MHFEQVICDQVADGFAPLVENLLLMFVFVFCFLFWVGCCGGYFAWPLPLSVVCIVWAFGSASR